MCVCGRTCIPQALAINWSCFHVVSVGWGGGVGGLGV